MKNMDERKFIPPGEMTFGEGEPTTKNYNRETACMNPDCPFYGEISHQDVNVIGVKMAPFINDKQRPYALMQECKNCSTIFWNHCTANAAATYKNIEERETEKPTKKAI